MSMLQTCKVIQALAASSKEKLTVKELEPLVDVPKITIMRILPRLVAQGRVLKEKPNGKGKYVYWINEESDYKSGRGPKLKEVSEDSTKAANSRRRVASRKKTMETRPLWMRVENGAQKVDLLKRVLSYGLTEQRKGLVRSMLQDYGVKVEE